jgi:tRNA-specific adenosine deaminase 2
MLSVMENFDSSNFKDDEIIFYMKEALLECENALKRGEVPVGCVFLHLPSMKIILRGHNLTNKTKNATTHAEINCIYYLFDMLSNQEERLKFVQDFQLDESYLDVDKLKEIFSDCALFVSCEPCIMCAYALNLVSKKN